jgi:hypothetical protein
MDPKVKFSECTTVRDVALGLIGWRRKPADVDWSCENVK